MDTDCCGDRHPNTAHLWELLNSWEHLPKHLQPYSRDIAEVARRMIKSLSDGPELSFGLRQLLLAKDAFVRQAVLDAQGAVLRD